MFTGIIFPSSSTVSLEIVESLNNIKDISVIGINSHDNYETKDLFQISYNDCPLIDEEELKCIEYLINIAKTHGCNFIIPTMDYSHLILSKHGDIFNRNNIKIITSSYETNKICVSKKQTYEALNDIVNCPILYSYDEINTNENNYINKKLFLKPDIGYGSRNCYIVNSIGELKKKYDESLIILEYLPNDEYTIDCFTYNKKLAYINIRKRKLYKNGLSVITENIEYKSKLYNTIERFANDINDTIDFIGSWFFQVKFDENNICKLLEVSTRIAGASSINRLNGCNLTLLSIYYQFGHPINIIKNNNYLLVSKIFKNVVNLNKLFTYNNIFIDFDDTIIINNKVNHLAMAFLYRELNNNKDIYLLTRHKNDIGDTLKQYRISTDIFKKIIVITDGTKKSNHVIEYSLFIDDSFKERNDVITNTKNVLCFDVDFFEYIHV